MKVNCLRRISILLIMLMMISCLAACAKSGNQGGNNTTGNAGVTTGNNEGATTQNNGNSGANNETTAPQGNDVNQGADDQSGANYAVSFSINPGIEFLVTIDEAGRDTIVEVVFLNDDARAVYDSMGINLVGMTVPDASRYFVDAAIKSGYLQQYHNVTISLDEAWNLPTDILEEMLALRDVTADVLADEERDDAYIQMDVNANSDIPVAAADDSGKPPLFDEAGNCAVCHGNLIVSCDLCGGRSHGDGRIECDACGATGGTTCDLCFGNGTVTCDQCGGSGNKDGEGCNGCSGTGITTCNRCNGAGGVVCDRCEGAGMMICYRCNGSLVMQCYRCDGTNDPTIPHE